MRRAHRFTRPDLAQLKADITAYRGAAPNAVFHIEHQFDEGDYHATRLTAQALDARQLPTTTICGLNISRWENDLLVEEWAVWESFSTAVPGVS